MRVEQPSERLLEYFTRVFVLCQVVRAIFCGGKLPAKVQSFICPSGTSRTPSPTVGQSTSHVFCICSGKFQADKEVYHVQSGRKLRLSQPQQIMAQDRQVISEAYAGDVIGVFDPGLFSIGDTITMPGSKFEYEGIPTFAPEHFARVIQLNSMKRKQFVKGITQIAQEGAIQIFQEYTAGMSEIIVGVVGVLQFDVLKYRLENEYGCEIRLESLPYGFIRWVGDPTTDVTKLKRMNNVKAVKDMKGNPLLLFVNDWMIRMVLEDNEGLELLEFKKN